MRQRASLIFSITALLVAVFGVTPLGHSAGEKLAAAVPPFAKRAGYAKFAGSAAKLNGRKSTLKGAPGTIPVVGRDGKLPSTIGAIGPQGPKGDKGDQGDKGDKGDKGDPGTSGYEIVTASTALDATDVKATKVVCPTGKKVVGGSATWNGYGPEAVGSSLSANGQTLFAVANEIPGVNPAYWSLAVWAVCMNVTS